MGFEFCKFLVQLLKMRTKIRSNNDVSRLFRRTKYVVKSVTVMNKVTNQLPHFIHDLLPTRIVGNKSDSRKQ